MFLALLTAGCDSGGDANSDDGNTVGDSTGVATGGEPTGGEPTGDTDDPTTGGEPASSEPLRSPLRRLSRAELTNTLADLFPTITVPALDLPVDKPQNLFGNSVDTQEPTDVYVESHWCANVTVADAVVADLPKVMGCDLPDDDTARQACADAYRRPVTQAEVDRHLADFLPTQWSTHGFDMAMKSLVTAVLNSPSFLYRAAHSRPSRCSRLASTRSTVRSDSAPRSQSMNLSTGAEDVKKMFENAEARRSTLYGCCSYLARHRLAVEANRRLHRTCRR